MQLRILKESDTEMEVEVVGEDHTLCNLLRRVLNEDEKVASAAYKIEHPLLSNPTLYFKLKESPKKKNKKELKLTDLAGLGPKSSQKLQSAGIKSVEDLARRAILEELAAKTGISEKLIGGYVKDAKKKTGVSQTRKFLKASLKELSKTFEGLRAEFEEAL